MNSDEAVARIIKQARRELINVLKEMYHIGPLSFDALCGALVHLELPDEECIKRDLMYLAEKGYVIQTNPAIAYQPWTKRLYKLTARGLDFAQRIAGDPALEP